MTTDKALDLALEKVANALPAYIEGTPAREYLAVIHSALAAPVQEPVAGQPLPCPFCGHIGLDFSDGETYRWGVASCGGCGASCGEVRREYPDKSEWHTEAIAEWNRRSPAAPDLQAELDATNRQVEILSDALAESRREVAALKAVQEPVAVDQVTMELAESVGLIGPSSRTHDLHAAIQRFHDLICVNATIKAAKMAADAIRESTLPVAPVAWKWHQAPVKTSWGHDMVVADLAIDKDNTVSVYCERDQTAKVEAMFIPPAAQRQWVGLTQQDRKDIWREAIGWGDPSHDDIGLMIAIEAKLKEKNT